MTFLFASHCKSSPSSFDECRLSAGWPPTPDQANQQGLLNKVATIHIHQCRLLLNPKTVTHFTVSWRVVGCVELGTAVRVCNPCPGLLYIHCVGYRDNRNCQL